MKPNRFTLTALVMALVLLLAACGQQTPLQAPSVQGNGTVSKQSGTTTVIKDQATCEAFGGSYSSHKNLCVFSADYIVKAGDTLRVANVNVNFSTKLTVNGTLDIDTSSCVTLAGSLNTGTINVNGCIWFFGGTHVNDGIININGGGTVTSFNNTTVSNNGEIKQFCGGSFVKFSTLSSIYSGNAIQDACAPSVMVEQASSQTDPTTASPIHFIATFSEKVTGFTDAHVTVGGTAGATTATVSEIAPNDGTTYDIAVSGMTKDGTVTASIYADKVTDPAGNKNTASTSKDNTVTFIVDATGPTAAPSQSPAANAASWNNSDVIVTWNWTDNTGGTGIDSTNCTTSSTSSVEGSALKLTATCKDKAGNQGSAEYTVNIDKVAPTISAAATTSPNANGWYNASVTVKFTCNDALSGVVACPADQTLSTEGSAVSSTAQTVTDKAGNVSASSNTVTVKIDQTAPSITITTAAQNAQYLLYQVVTPSYTCTDASGASGVASCTSSAFSTATTGSKTFTVNASDNAGNSSSQSVGYSVISASSGVGNLINQVNALNLEKNTANPFISLLQNVQADLSKNNKAGALDKLTSFISHVNAQRGKKISIAQADSLIAYANLIIASIKAAP